MLQQLIAKKWLGAKTKQGFYKKVGDDILQLDLKTLEYGPQKKPRFDSIGATRGVDDVDEKLRRMVAGNDRAAALARTVLYETLIYSANRLGEIADDVVDIDRALRWGFGWERGPFETWDALGVKATAAKMEAAGYTVPGWVQGADRRAGRRHALLPAGDKPASRASSASAAASRRSRPTRARCRSTRSAPPAARWSATAARRSSTSATASSASSSTPR